MKALFLVSLGLLLISLLLMPVGATSAATCIAREYPQLDDWGNVIWVTQWCDGTYTWEVDDKLSAPRDTLSDISADQANQEVQPAATGNSVTVPTRARVVAP
ncbi:MAG: hypothetical protein M1370_03685 [Bacteroidetes bacterium]|nr:hypothetical protein [Bacteroidota bacterium]MCL5025074.1 hypothetical protein [Chloroflexota bacterium]